jgi:signal transduction histidine kinase
MKEKLSKAEKNILDKLDRILAGQSPGDLSSFLEEKLWQTLKKFEYSEQKREKDKENIHRLMSDIAHQIKTPLSALFLHLELALDESLSFEEQISAIRECRKQADKINFLSETMFKVVKLETGLISVKRVEADIVKTIEDSISSVKPAAESKNIEIKSKLPESLEVMHDPFWTKEALVNILDNAVKYTNTGEIIVQIEQGAIYTRIDIEDTGIGITSEDYAKIFARFYRAHTAGTERIEGTGLGLFIAREILRRQDGNITVSSIVKKGSVFSVFLQNCQFSVSEM